jgi:hypothetical protein
MMNSMKLSALFVASVVTLGTPVSAQDFTVTGEYGGTIVGNRDCIRANGQANCTKSSVITGPQGNVSTRTRERVTTQDGSNITVRTTGPNGRTYTRNTTITRN